MRKGKSQVKVEVFEFKFFSTIAIGLSQSNWLWGAMRTKWIILQLNFHLFSFYFPCLCHTNTFTLRVCVFLSPFFSLTCISLEFAYVYWIMWREFKFSAYLFVCSFFVLSVVADFRNGKNTRHNTQEVQSTTCTGIAFIPTIFLHFVLNPECFNFFFSLFFWTFLFLFYFCRKQSYKQKSFVL